MLKRGVYVHPWHNMFLSAAMTDGDIDAALDAASGAFNEMRAQRAAIKPSPKLQAFFAPKAVG
jgi:glutamate-1-semialdehyde 2,1-aminomutase